MVVDDVGLILDEYDSNFINYEIAPGIFIFKDFSEVLSSDLRSDIIDSHSITIEFDDIIMKTKLDVNTKISGIRFDEKSVFSTILGFTTPWKIDTILDTLVKNL